MIQKPRIVAVVFVMIIRSGGLESTNEFIETNRTALNSNKKCDIVINICNLDRKFGPNK